MTFGVLASAHVPFPATDYATEVLADSPTIYWRLGESSGSTVNDETGTIDGTYYNGPTLGASGIPGAGTDTAVTFNGTNQYVQNNSDVNLLLVDATNGVAYECWYKGTDTDNDAILAANTNASAKRFSLGVDADGKAIAKTENSYSVCGPSTTTINDGNWHHLVLTIEGGTYDAALYVDGSLEASDTAPDDAGIGNPAFTIGRNARNNEYAAGTVDEVAVYKPGGSTALSAARIAAHYSAGSAA